MSEEFIVKDSGKRESFNSGAVRDTSEDKPRPDLISPFFLKRLGVHMAKGAKKYSAHNWAKGIPNSRCYESCMRHLMQFAMGDRTEDHLSAAAFNIMAMVHNEEVSADNVDFVERSGAVGLVDMPVFVKGEEGKGDGVSQVLRDRILVAIKELDKGSVPLEITGRPDVLETLRMPVGTTFLGLSVTQGYHSGDFLGLHYGNEQGCGYRGIRVGDLI